jgi:hypothetical protein
VLIITIEDELTSQSSEHVIITNEDGSQVSIPALEDNPRYQQFLEQLEGNEPDLLEG